VSRPGRPGVFVLRQEVDWVNHSELGVARSLGRLGVPVWGVTGGGLAVRASRFNRGRLAYHPARPLAARLERLLDIGRELGRPILIPTDDDASVLVDEHAGLLSEAFRFPLRPDGLTRRLSDKGELHDLCAELGIPAPKAEFPRSRSDVERYAAGGPFPVVLKRMAAWLPARGDPRSVEIAHDAEAMLDAYEGMESPERPNVMLQEHVPGDPSSVWMFNGYFDERSGCLAGFTGVKVRQTDHDTGPTSLGVCRANPEVYDSATRLMKAVGYRGIVDMGYRYDARDGRYKLLDVNPRLGSSFRLFVAPNGMDVLRALYLDLTGEQVPGSADCDGRRWMVENHDLLSAFHGVRSGELDARGWLRSVRGVDERAWFARDDPLPFAAMWLEFSLEVARRRVRRKPD
jgi:D-aspartate ligase